MSLSGLTRNLRSHVRQGGIRIDTGRPATDLFRQMRQQDVGVAAQITITPAAAL